MAGFALLFLPEEEAFWCLAAMINRIMPPTYYVDPMTQSRADQPVLADAVEKWMPDVHAALERTGFDLSMTSFSWFFTLFVDCVPTESTVRIWYGSAPPPVHPHSRLSRPRRDLVLLEGDTVLFRFAWAVLKVNEPALAVVGTDIGEMFALMQCLGRNCTDPDRLVRLALDECPFDMDYIAYRRVVCFEQLKVADAKLKLEVEERLKEGDGTARAVPDRAPSSPAGARPPRPPRPATRPVAATAKRASATEVEPAPDPMPWGMTNANPDRQDRPSAFVRLESPGSPGESAAQAAAERPSSRAEGIERSRASSVRSATSVLSHDSWTAVTMDDVPRELGQPAPMELAAYQPSPLREATRRSGIGQLQPDPRGLSQSVSTW